MPPAEFTSHFLFQPQAVKSLPHLELFFELIHQDKLSQKTFSLTVCSLTLFASVLRGEHTAHPGCGTSFSAIRFLFPTNIRKRKQIDG